MSCIGNGKMVTFELADRRLITLDLDCEEDWGDITIIPGYRVGGERILIGGEEDSRIEAVRFWEEIDNVGADLDWIGEKWQSFAEIAKEELIEMVLVRTIRYSDGMTKDDLFDLLKEYGFDPAKIYIPQEYFS